MRTERKQIRRAIEEWFDGPVHSLLIGNGFVQAREIVSSQESLQMFRSRAKQIEVVGCRVAQRIGVDNTELFAEMGIFLRSVPHYSGAKFSGVDNLSLRSTLDCHFRQSLKPSWVVSPSLTKRTSWLIKSVESNIERCLSDAFSKIESAGLPWFDRYSDLRMAYQALVEKRQLGPNLPGVWGQVYGETLVKGFLGLEYRDWPTAVASLNAALALMNPYHSLDASQPKRLYHQFEREIERALALARAEMGK